MKKIISLVLMVAMLSSMAFATDTTLDDDSLTMDYVDSKIVTFCIENQGVPQDVNVVVDPICKDLNTLLGCSAGDDFGVDEAGDFTVVPASGSTGADGCVNLTVTTNLVPGEEGLFYYTVNGKVGESIVGTETGQVFVPEFGVVAAGLALAGAGVYIARKRKQ